MRFLSRRGTLAIASLAVLPGGITAQQNTARPDLPNPYRTVSDVVTMPAGRAMGSSNAIDVDSRGNIWLFERCGANTCLDSDVDPILQFDPQGRLLQSFGAGMFVFPHGIIVDDEDNVWIVDAGVAEGKGNQIFKFGPRGEVLLTIGEPGVRGETETLLNEPSDLAIAPNGDVYVADGHIAPESNARIVRFDRNGRFISAWGTKGAGPGELDSRGRVFVGDRTNNRIQIFSPDGELLDVWRQFGRPSGVRIVDDVVYVADSESRAVEGAYGYNPGYHRGIYVGSVHDGVVSAFIPDPNPSGGTSFPEGISVADDGTIWGASVGNRTAWKWIRD
jgi:streptogramin lyase